MSKGWSTISKSDVNFLRAFINIERILNFEHCSELEKLNEIVFIHVGRAVSFKAPEESFYIALCAAMMGFQVVLHCVGIYYLPDTETLEIPDELQELFHGSILNALELTLKRVSC